MEYNELTEPQKAKATECKTPEDLMALAKEEGVELSDEQLETVAGGWGSGCRDDCYTVDYLHKPKPSR